MVKSQPPMRVMKRDEKEFKRLRRNYRAKLNRVRKSTGFSLDEADKWLGVEIPSIKDMRNGKAFKSRKEFNDWKKQLQDVNSRTFTPLQIETNKKGLRYPKIVQQRGRQATQKAQQHVDEMIEQYSNLPQFVDGEEMGTVDKRQLMLGDKESYGLYKPEDFDIDNFVNPKSVENNITKNEERQTKEYYDERMERMRDNFISIFDDPDNEENQKIVEKLKNIPPDDFYEMYLMLPEMDFEDWDSETGGFIGGDKSPQEVFGYFLDVYEQGNIDLSLKGLG